MFNVDVDCVNFMVETRMYVICCSKEDCVTGLWIVCDYSEEIERKREREKSKNTETLLLFDITPFESTVSVGLFVFYVSSVFVSHQHFKFQSCFGFNDDQK